jgi:hypothetical protein
VQLEELGQLKNPKISSGIEPACSIVSKPTALPPAPRRGWVDNIKMEIEWGGTDWIDLA